MFFEYDELINECEVIQDGLIAYNNAFVIDEYRKEYGYTEHFRMLIGEEVIFQQASEAVGRFLSWLKKVVVDLLSRIKKFVIRVVNKILAFFGLKPIQSGTSNQSINTCINQIEKDLQEAISSDRVFKIPYFLKSIKDDFREDAIIKFNNNHSVIIDDEEQVSTYIDCIRKIESNLMKSLEKDTDDDVSTVSANTLRFVMKVLCKTFYDNINQLNAATDMLESIKSKTSADENIFVVGKKIKDILNSDNTFGVNVRIYEDTKPTVAITNTMRCLTTCISAYTKITQRSSEVLLDVSKIIHDSDDQIHIGFPIDYNLKRRLDQFFGKSFKLNKIYFTNVHPSSWDLDVDDNVAFGWCVSGYNNTGARDIYINYRAYRRMLKTSFPDTRKVVERLIRTIIHECTHIYDAQTGGKFEGNDVEYEDRIQEKRAFHNQDAFIVTKHDISWCESIIRQIEASIKKK